MPSAASLQPPVEVELAPGLRAFVVAHDIANGESAVPCWSYLTEGLAAHGQPEIVFTLRRTALDPEPPVDPLHVFAAILPMAQRGRIATAGGFSGFAPNAFLRAHGWAGWVYVAAREVAGLPVADGALHALAVTTEELAVAQTHGATRIASRLGRATCHFPYPPWSEARASVAAAGEEASSMLASCARIGGLGITVTQIGRALVIDVPRSAAANIAGGLPRLPMDAVLVFLANPAPYADACLVWHPGQHEPTAIAAPGAEAQHLAGTFVGFVPQQERDEMMVVEDGFMVLVTDDTWAAVRSALASGEPASFTAGHTSIEVRWS